MRDITIQRGSIEYVEFSLTDAEGGDLTGDEIEFTIGNADDRVWLPAVWENGFGRSFTPVTFDATYSIGTHPVYARVFDTPEVPIVRLGSIRVVR